MSMSVVLQYMGPDEALPRVTVAPVDAGQFASVRIGTTPNEEMIIYVNYTDCRTFAARLEKVAARLRELGTRTMHVVPRFRLIEERDF